MAKKNQLKMYRKCKQPFFFYKLLRKWALFSYIDLKAKRDTDKTERQLNHRNSCKETSFYVEAQM